MSLSKRQDGTENIKLPPMVGIFWITPDLEDIFYASSVETDKGIVYGDWILGTDDHTILWDRLYSEGELKMLPRRYQEDYTLLPRGRVSFNSKAGEFTVYHGNWLKPKHKKIIMDRFHLARNQTVFEEDEHYRI